MGTVLSEYYKFKQEDAYAFAAHVNAMANNRGSELVFKKCPYCGRDTRDEKTFSINMTTGQFQCKRASCRAKGNMITLSKDFNFSLGIDVDSYYRPEIKTYRPARVLPAYVPKDSVVRYMQDRKISPEIVEKYHLSIKQGNDNIMAIPFLNIDGKIECVKYRKMDFDKNNDRNKEWFETNCKPILFGMAQCCSRERLVITEGQMDAMALAEAGIENAVSVPNGANGFTWIPHCWDFVNQFEQIVVFGDRENEQITLIDTISSRFNSKKVLCVRDIDYRDCKDANEILVKYGKQFLVNAVNNAILQVKGRIIEMSDVGYADIENREAIQTGFPSLDKALSGGFHLGSLVVVTGKRGDGKSTFVSQIMCNALDQFNRLDKSTGELIPINDGAGYKTFIYSGELTNEYVKNWLTQQLSGYKRPPADIDKAMNDYIRGRAYMYDCNSVYDEMEDVPSLLEEAILKFGCQLLVIDNLMSALDVTSSDLIKAQAGFVEKLAKIAKKHNVVVMLIAHPRKMSTSDSNDNISGSSNITDRADIVLHYERDIEKDNDSTRRVSVSKNRLTGRLVLKRDKINDDRVEVHYIEDNKRIIEANCKPAWHKWDEEFISQNAVTAEDVPEIPWE